MHLSGLYIYPVKSLRGCAVASAHIDALGLVGDRRFLIVDPTGLQLTQRVLPRMALVETALDATSLILRATDAGEVRVARTSDPAAPLRAVSVWSSHDLLAEDCGDEPAAWLAKFLGVTCRLVRIGEKFSRPILKSAALTGDFVSFADSCPFLIIGESSLADLNDRLVTVHEEAVPMNRFRPNLVVTGCPAFAEDSWPRLQIGELTFRAAGPCVRCIITTTNQLTAERGKEPLRTLARYRRDPQKPNEVNFGQNLIHETKTGIIRIDDIVTPL